MNKLLIIFSYILLATACQQNDEEYITQTTELSALDQFSSNLEKQNPNISNSSTRANQASWGFIVNISWYPSPKISNEIRDIPHSTAMGHLETVAAAYSNIHHQPIQAEYYAAELYGVARIGLKSNYGYVASEMFVREFLPDFASLLYQDSTIGTSFDFEFDVNYPEWPPVTGDTITR